ncbi:MAG TPA: 2-aminoethylphosphonate--pyruvate transaminase [Alphaproteobacteria bacterium]|nr:2-aminoethylphosphonate--pyruvate transaminase [Alphaproteobacteria bacterium]
MAGRDPYYLLTPGPITTSARTKQAMLHDWGSRDQEIIEATRRIGDALLAIAGAEKDHVCIPMQGSGTFAVEAALGTLIPREGPKGSKALVLINGAYGRRMAKILGVMGRPCATFETAEDTPPSAAEVDGILGGDGEISHVLCVHCETTSGIANPLAEIAKVVADHKRSLIIDAMSSFGALPLNASEVQFDAVVASSNKCLEGVPGIGFVIARRSVMEAAAGNAHSLSLDLYEQWRAMEANGQCGQWRFTPPTHVIKAFEAALDQFDGEGGRAERYRRYAENRDILISGMREMGFETFLPDSSQAPIIVTFLMPADPNFDFDVFYDGLKTRGFVIYPGKLTGRQTFRMGCIGHLAAAEMNAAVEAVRDTITAMGVKSGAAA